MIIAVTDTLDPSVTGFGLTDSVAAGAVSPSVMVMSTDEGGPAPTVVVTLPIANVNVSSSKSASSVVLIVPVPEVYSAEIADSESVP